jgi:hypothetical protein
VSGEAAAHRADGEEKQGEGERGQWWQLLKALGVRGGEGKGGGVSMPHGGRRRSGEEPDTAVGRAPGHRARVAALWHDRGGRQGTVDSARATDRRDRAVVGPGGGGGGRERRKRGSGDIEC